MTEKVKGRTHRSLAFKSSIMTLFWDVNADIQERGGSYYDDIPADDRNSGGEVEV